MTVSNCTASLGASTEGFLRSVQVLLLEMMAVGTGEQGRLCCPSVGLSPRVFSFSN